MKHDENIEKRMAEASVPNITEGPHRERLKCQLLHAMQTKDARVQKWRRIMKSRIARVAAAAAVIIIASVVFMALLRNGVRPAYALEQTVEANHSVRYIRMVFYKASQEAPKKAWLEFNEHGGLEQARLYIPEWDSPQDGAKDIVWKGNKVQIWLKKKNVFATLWDNKVAADIVGTIREIDPKRAIRDLYEQEAKGEVRIDAAQPSDNSKPIAVTATYLPESSKPNQRMVLFVDQASRLVIAAEMYHLEAGKYQYIGRREYYDYNKAIDPGVFALDVPANALRIDQTTQEIGLAQGDLTDNEIAKEVVRQFLEALIAKDYGKAGRLCEGLPAEFIAKKMDEADEKIVRIISLGEPVPHSETASLRVPYTVEMEKDGERSQISSPGPFVRQVYGQPGRWTISGGI
jgi:hypothetical protein